MIFYKIIFPENCINFCGYLDLILKQMLLGNQEALTYLGIQ